MKTKRCSRCEETKSLKDFYKGYSACKPCHIESVRDHQATRKRYYQKYRQKYYSENTDKVSQWKLNFAKRWEKEHGYSYNDYLTDQRRERYQNDPEYRAAKKAYGKAYRKKNLKAVQATQRAWYQKNREKHIANVMANYNKNKKLKSNGSNREKNI